MLVVEEEDGLAVIKSRDPRLLAHYLTFSIAAKLPHSRDHTGIKGHIQGSCREGAECMYRQWLTKMGEGR